MRIDLVKHIASLVAVAVLTGCSSDSTGPQGNMDLAPVLNEISTGSSASYSSAPVSSVSAGSSGSPTWVPSACSFSSTSHGFVCPEINAGGLKITRSFFLYDASGAAQTAADVATTASVRTITDVSGTLAPPPGGNVSGSITIARHDDITLSGLLTGAHTLNGAGTGHSDTQLSGQTTTHFVVDETSKTTNLVLPEKGGSSHFPKSGSIELNQTLTATVGSGQPDKTTIMHELLTFDGTSVITIEFAIGGSTRTCKLNLSNLSASTGCTV